MPPLRWPTCPSARRSASSWRARWPREPKLLLLDEPASGLNHEEVGGARRRWCSELRRRFALTVLLVEHHMRLVMRISDRVVALNFGRKIAEGTPDEVQRHPDVVRAYLGTLRCCSK